MIHQAMLVGGAQAQAASEQHFLFTTAADGTDVDFFGRSPQTEKPDASLFDVYVDGTLSGQSLYSLTFTGGQQIEIRARSAGQWYPVFFPGGTLAGYYDENNDYAYVTYDAAAQLDLVASIDDALPEMRWAEGTPLTAASYSALLPDDFSGWNQPYTDFVGMFKNCTALTSIPENLFANNPQVTDFSYAFFHCTGLTAIPAGLFDNCTNVTAFSDTFSYCSGLTAIPTGLFDNNTAVMSFNRTFDRCSGLTTVPSTLFDVQSTTGKVTNVNYCFYGDKAITSALPEPWNWPKIPSTHNMYAYNCTNASNYSSVPSGWK